MGVTIDYGWNHPHQLHALLEGCPSPSPSPHWLRSWIQLPVPISGMSFGHTHIYHDANLPDQPSHGRFLRHSLHHHFTCHQEEITFYVRKSRYVPLVLGRPWRHNPQVDWVQGIITGWSLGCHASCLQSASCQFPSIRGIEEIPPDLSSVPAFFHNIGQVQGLLPASIQVIQLSPRTAS